MNNLLLESVSQQQSKILIVDDKAANLVALEKLLQEFPAEIVRASSGNEALALTLEHEFALALVDVQMPDMDGYETVSLMREQEATRDIPVIFLSAVYSGDYYRIKGVESGAVGFLEKPLIPEILLGKVRLFLEMDRYRRALQQANAELEKRVAERTDDLQRTLNLLNAAQRIARLGFYERNLQTGEGRWTDGLYRLLGVAPGSIPCTFEAFQERVHPEDLEHFRASFKQAAERLGTYSFEFRMLDGSGEMRFMRTHGITEGDSQGTALYRGMLQDVTERKRVEQEHLELQVKMQHVQKLESLGVMAGGIAHDFNNLLMAVLGNAELALMKLSPVSPGRDNIQEVVTASQRASELCKQMLAYSGKGKFVIEEVNLAELTEEMAHLLSVTISKKAVLKFNFADNVPPVKADASQIRQIIMNLVTNASEAIGDRSGVIAVSTGVMYCDRDYLDNLHFEGDLAEGYYSYVEVSDTGCGMSKETLDRLFDPFFTTKFTGRGLGLSAVLGIVRGHHGAIKPYSEQGKGTTFKVLLPALMDEILEGDTLGGNTDPGEFHVGGTVLVVDDEEAVCTIARGMLEHFGFDVLVAQDGRQALEIFKKHCDEIVCVVLDLTMPHMGGEDCFRELRRIKKDVPVLLSSGYTAYDVLERFAGKGLAGFVQKPYTKDEFSGALQHVLGLSAE